MISNKIRILTDFHEKHKMQLSSYAGTNFIDITQGMTEPQCEQLLSRIEQELPKIIEIRKQSNKKESLSKFIFSSSSGSFANEIANNIREQYKSYNPLVTCAGAVEMSWFDLANYFVFCNLRQHLLFNPMSLYRGMEWTKTANDRLVNHPLVHIASFLPEIIPVEDGPIHSEIKSLVPPFDQQPLFSSDKSFPVSGYAAQKLAITMTCFICSLNYKHKKLREKFEADRERLYPTHRDAFKFCEWLIPSSSEPEHQAFNSVFVGIRKRFEDPRSFWWTTVPPELKSYIGNGYDIKPFAEIMPFSDNQMDRVKISGGAPAKKKVAMPVSLTDMDFLD